MVMRQDEFKLGSHPAAQPGRAVGPGPGRDVGLLLGLACWDAWLGWASWNGQPAVPLEQGLTALVLGWRWIVGHGGQKGSSGGLVMALADMEVVCLVRQLINTFCC